MSKKVSMPFYYDWEEALEDIPEKDFKPLVLSMVRYHKDGTPPPDFSPPDFDSNTKMAAKFIFPQIDRAKVNAENGRKGGKTTQSTSFGSTDGSTDGSNTNTNTLTNTNTNTLTDTLTNTPSVEKQTEFEKPTLEQVREYAKEQGSNINPDEFYNCYEAVGWTSKGEAIKDWKALLSAWGKNESRRAAKTPNRMVKPIGGLENRISEEEAEFLHQNEERIRKANADYLTR